MIALVLTALQILLLLLKARFSKDSDVEQARAHLAQAQEILAQVAESFEERVRYSNIDPQSVDRLQDQADQDRTNK
jgi:hypothetical protein